MKKIVGILRPFLFKQQLFVYENGNKVDMVEVTMDEVAETVLGLCYSHAIREVDLTGPTKYSVKVRADIQNAEIAKYSKNDIKIDII